MGTNSHTRIRSLTSCCAVILTVCIRLFVSSHSLHSYLTSIKLFNVSKMSCQFLGCLRTSVHLHWFIRDTDVYGYALVNCMTHPLYPWQGLSLTDVSHAIHVKWRTPQSLHWLTICVKWLTIVVTRVTHIDTLCQLPDEQLRWNDAHKSHISDWQFR